MITDEQLIAYESGAISGSERARFEEALANDPLALRRWMDQERTETALHFLAGGNGDRARVRQGILEIALSNSSQQLKKAVLDEIRETTHFNPLSWLSRWFALAGAAAGLAIMAFLFWPSPATAIAGRDPVEWPFAPNSPWNTPIGSEARFEAPMNINLEKGAFIVDAYATHPIHVVTPKDPVGRIFLRGKPDPFATLQIPRSALDDLRWRLTVNIFDGDEVIELHDVTASGGDLNALAVARGNLRGSGIPPELRAPNSSGISPLAGRIRASEITGGIAHTLGAVVPINVVDRTTQVWPAVAGQSPRQPGKVHLGSLLAIPPEIDLATLGITNSVAFALARAMQDYGVYVKDFFQTNSFHEWREAGSPDLVFCAELDWNKLPLDFTEQLARATRELRLVSNSSPQSVGGGGARRRPLAPAFQP